MTTASPICEGWPTHEFTSFLSAIRRAEDAVTPRNDLITALYSGGGSPRQGLLAASTTSPLLRSAEAIRAEQLSEAYRRAREIIAAEPLWRRLQKDDNFRVLFSKVEPKLDPHRPDGQLRFFEAVAIGVLAARSPRRYADQKTRDKAAKHAAELKRLRANGIRLADYRETEELWRLLEKLVHEMESTRRKPREDNRSGVREALDLFLKVLFLVVSPDQVSGAMLCAYAAMLGDTSEREVEKQLTEAKRDWKKLVRAAELEALRKASTSAGPGENGG